MSEKQNKEKKPKIVSQKALVRSFNSTYTYFKNNNILLNQSNVIVKYGSNKHLQSDDTRTTPQKILKYLLNAIKRSKLLEREFQGKISPRDFYLSIETVFDVDYCSYIETFMENIMERMKQMRLYKTTGYYISTGVSYDEDIDRVSIIILLYKTGKDFEYYMTKTGLSRYSKCLKNDDVEYELKQQNIRKQAEELERRYIRSQKLAAKRLQKQINDANTNVNFNSNNVKNTEKKLNKSNRSSLSKIDEIVKKTTGLLK